MNKQRLLSVVNQAGWEREDAHTFQENRVRLVQILDRFLAQAAAATSNSASIVLDGQLIELEDYLEIRHDQVKLITRLVQAGKIEIGPWYVVPHEHLVSGEALIRNLLIGRSKAAAFGASIEVGYAPGSHGHIAQLPQIFQGFGIETGIATAAGAAFGRYRWQSPNGSEIWLINASSSDGEALGSATTASALKYALQSLSAAFDRSPSSEVLLLMNSDTAHIPGYRAGDLQAAASKVKNVDLRTGTLASFLDGGFQPDENLGLIFGALDGIYATSTRIEAKQRNHFVQGLLERWVEPLNAWLSIADLHDSRGKKSTLERESPAASFLINYAWETLLKNHSPTTLGGHIADQAHREAMVRFDHAEQIAETLTGQLLSQLASQIDTRRSGIDEIGQPVIVFNPEGRYRSNVADVSLILPSDSKAAEVVDADGNPIPSVMINDSGAAGEVPGETPIRLRILASELPPVGYKTFFVRFSDNTPLGVTRDDANSIENEYLTVQVDPLVGTLTLFDKRTGRSFTGLNRYVDGGDSGDAFNYCSPPRDTIIDIATNTPIYVERAIGPIDQSLTFLQIYRIPRELTPSRDARLPLAAQFVPISIMTTVQLVRGVPRIDVMATVANSALDHRLSVHFPAGGGVERAYIDSSFSVTTPTFYGDDTQGFLGYEGPQGQFTTVVGTDTGLTIANRGLPEVRIFSDNGTATIALTLLRCIAWLSRDDLAARQGHAGQPLEIPSAQCVGDHTFHYSIIPHGVDATGAWHEARAFQSTARGIITDRHKGRLPDSGSLVSVAHPSFMLTSIKMSEDGSGVVVRGYNCADSPIEVTLQPGFATHQARRARLDETPQGRSKSPERGGAYQFEVRPAEILTVILYAVP